MLPLPWAWHGRMGYGPGIEYQESVRQRMFEDSMEPGELVLLEHRPVITLGRNAGRDNILLTDSELANRGVEVVRATRGGNVTYHGPGQLMVYAVVRLQSGIIAHLRALAEGLAEVARALGNPGARFRRDCPGLWIENRKLGACGLHVRRGVAIHGFSFNVSTPAEAWQTINPCGMTDVSITSIARECARRGLDEPPSVECVARMCAPAVCRALGRFPKETVVR